MNETHHKDANATVNSGRMDASQSPNYLERLKTWEGLPVTVGDLERILAAGRSMPEILDGIPGGKWWPALVLTIVNAADFASTILELPLSAYDRDKGILHIGRKKIRLHAHTANALESLRRYERDRLFPWPKDNRCRPYYMLYHDYQEVLHRAGLPPMQKRPLMKLRTLGERYPEILDCIDPTRPHQPVLGKPERNRKRKPKRRRPTNRHRVYLIADDSPDALKNYFAETYQPLKLINCSKRSIERYQGVIKGFSEFLGCDANLSHLTDDRVGQYSAWMAGRDYEPTTINTHLRHLLSLWRHAWKKRRVDELPRDVDFLKEPKHIPEAWSTEEMARLLEAARHADGEMFGIPANQWFGALLLVMYDTGARLGSLLLLRTDDFSLESGEVLLRAETQKQSADQYFRVHPETLEAVRAINPQLREFVWNYPQYNRNRMIIYRALDRILNAAGLPTTARDKFHKVRRTSATVLADQLGEHEASKHLGHSSIEVTRRYLDPSKIRRRVNAADVMVRPELRDKAG